MATQRHIGGPTRSNVVADKRQAWIQVVVPPEIDDRLLAIQRRRGAHECQDLIAKGDVESCQYLIKSCELTVGTILAVQLPTCLLGDIGDRAAAPAPDGTTSIGGLDVLE